MPNPVEGLFEVYEDMVEVLLVLEIFLTQNAQVEDLLYCTPSCSVFVHHLFRHRPNMNISKTKMFCFGFPSGKD